MTVSGCECLGYCTDDSGHLVCVDCGEPLDPAADPLLVTPDMQEAVDEARAEADSAPALTPFGYRH